MSQIVAGIRIPDSKLAKEATDLLREHGTPLLFAHSLRVFVFGALVTGGVEVDVLGDGLDEISPEDRADVVAAYPRVDFKRGIVQAFADGFAYKPATTFGTMNTDVLEKMTPGYRRPNFCELIAANPLGG